MRKFLNTIFIGMGVGLGSAFGGLGEGTSGEAEGTMTVTMSAPQGDFVSIPQKRVVSMPGLLFTDAAGRSIGSASSIIFTMTSAASGGGQMNLGFNRTVGDSMRDSLPKIEEFLKDRIGGWPVNEKGEFRFENKYNPKDGDSASVVCSLLIYSGLTGYEISPDICITGAMEPDGKVKPIGGLMQKIGGAQRAGIEVLAFPAENYDSLQDIVLQEGVGGLDGFQAFTLEHFEDALDLANATRPESLESAIARFSQLREAAGGNPAYFKTAGARAELAKVLDEAPNHATARIFLEALNGNLPSTISLSGSFDAIMEAWKPMQVAVASGEFTVGSSLDEDLYATSASRLNRLRPMLSTKARPLSDAVLDLAVRLKKFRQSPPTSPTGLREAINAIENSAENIDTEMENFGEAYELEYGTEDEE